MLKTILSISILVIVASSCSVKKFLPKEERLYRGATIIVEKWGEVNTTTHSLKKDLKLSSKPRSNKFLWGQPYQVWWWYVIGEPKRPRGIRAFIRNKLGEAPVFSNSVNAKVTAANMQSFLENRGFFHSTVSGDTINSDYFTRAVYKARVHPQYTINEISWVDDSTDLVKLLKEKQQDGILRKGNGYRLSDIQAEIDRLDGLVKMHGYYYFNPDYIMAYVDSTIGNNKVDLYLSIKSSAPTIARHPYTINQVMIFPNYTLLQPPPDTSKTGTFNMDGLLIRDTVQKIKPVLFKRVITYRPGSLYSSREQNTTLNRLINVGTFKFVKNRFTPVRDTADPYRLNVFYYITQAKQKSIQAELNGFSKENRFIGSQFSVTWRNRNAFKGAQLLAFKAYGAFEMSFSDSLKNANNFRIGGEASISFPRYYIPLFRPKESYLYPPRTRILLGYELFRKQYFYSKNIYRARYEFNWKETSNKEHSLSPISLTYINAGNITEVFGKQMLLNPALGVNTYSELIPGSFYAYTFTTANPFAKKQLYFRGSVELAGNIAGLITGAREPRQKKIFNTPFAQYTKADMDLRYQTRLKNNFDWANRLQIGIGIPYNNSNILPFTRQYMIGGSGSLRGFQMRQMGPGSYLPTLYDQWYYQVIGGDFKLQLNTEMRMPLFGRFSAAAFVDAGNIWTKDTLLFGEAGKLKKDFYKEIAVGAGVGLRIDAGVILLRMDLGVPLRKPHLPDGQRWVFNKIALGDGAWRRENLVLHIALGYPF